MHQGVVKGFLSFLRPPSLRGQLYSTSSCDARSAAGSDAFFPLVNFENHSVLPTAACCSLWWQRSSKLSKARCKLIFSTLAATIHDVCASTCLAGIIVRTCSYMRQATPVTWGLLPFDAPSLLVSHRFYCSIFWICPIKTNNSRLYPFIWYCNENWKPRFQEEQDRQKGPWEKTVESSHWSFFHGFLI